MKKFAGIALMALAACLPAQAKYIPDPIVKYKISARLDPVAKTVRGYQVITWRNHTADTIPDLQFHLYLNAFKNVNSTFMREGGGSQRRVKFSNRDDSWGYQQIHSIRVDGEDLTVAMEYIRPDDGNPHDQTVMRLPLIRPIPPGGQVEIEMEWTSKLPRVFARTGFHDNFYFVAQWYPKPGVYEAAGERHRQTGGWNCHQFHASTEFYADFGTFDVDLTVPSDFAIGATGVQRSSTHNRDGTTTYNYYQEDVHDFAWTAQPAKDVLVLERVFQGSERASDEEVQNWATWTGTPEEQVRLDDITVTLFLQREHASQAERHFRAAFHAIKWFGLMYGKYPYETLTVVDPPFGASGAGGMEYPTLITAGTDYWPGALDQTNGPEGVVVHEFGHQYWYGLVASNEFEEAWLDEGFNTYSTGKVMERAYGPTYTYVSIFGVPIPGRPWLDLPVPRYPWKGVKDVALGPYWEWVPVSYLESRRKRYAEHASSDAMDQYAWETLNWESYQVQAYDKPALTLFTFERVVGDDWAKLIRTYHQRFRFRHPDATDFQDTVKEVTGRDFKWFFDQTLRQTSTLEYSVSFTTGAAPAKKGFFDRDGQPTLPDPAEAAKTRETIESEVLVRRLGNYRFPVVIHVRFADGQEVRERWNGQYRWAKFSYARMPRIISVELDRDYDWKLEVPRTDNSALAEPVRLAADKWYLRWVVWIQNVLMAFSFFA